MRSLPVSQPVLSQDEGHFEWFWSVVGDGGRGLACALRRV